MLSYTLSIVATYWAVSYVFLKSKWMTNSKKKEWKSELVRRALNKELVLHVAHRGGSRERLENTIESFENGVKKGANILEMDVCLTKDNQIVVIHDNNLKRMCGLNSNVEEFNYNALPKFQSEINLDFSVSQKAFVKDSKTPYIPLLEEVFEKFPNIIMNIEIKTPTNQFIELLNQLIIKHKREDITIWGCKNTIMSQRMKQVNPNIKRFFSLGGLSDLFLKYFTGILPFCEVDEDSLQIPIFNEEHYQWKKLEQRTFMQHLQHRIYFTVIRILSSKYICDSLFEHLRQRGVTVIFWVVNEPQDFKNCLSHKGCVGIMTDCPSLLTSYLKQQNLYCKC